MADQAREWTDKKLAKIEKQIAKNYGQVEKELTKEWNKYAKKADKELAKLEAKYDKEWNKSFDKLNFTKIDKLSDEIIKEKELYLMKSADYRGVVEQITNKLANANQIALDYINDAVPDIYAKNFSQVGFDIDNIKINYEGYHPDTIKKIVNEDVVKNMIKDGDVKLQKKKLNVFKDVKWNTKKMNSAVLQGIIKGESIQQMSKRIAPIVQGNRKSAIRNARTLVTGAENRGRNDSYKRLQDAGLVLKKVWLATGDGRTRDWHIDMDGVEVDPKESFVTIYSELEYPGDPGGDPADVYNCRCSMITDIVGFKMADGNISYVEHVDEGQDLHDIEIAKEKANRIQKIQDYVAQQNIRNAEARQVVNQSSAVATEATRSYGTFEGIETWKNLVDNNDVEVMEDWTDDWWAKLNVTEKEAVRTYTGSAYRSMNGFLRGRRDSTAYEDEIKYCKNALNKASLPERTIVRRGSSYGSLEGMIDTNLDISRLQTDEAYRESFKGMIAHDSGFLSTSPDPYGGFGGDVTYWIELPQGSHAMYIDRVSLNQGELETLIQCDGYYYLHEITCNDWGKVDVFVSYMTEGVK